jgi:exodeoxyribonuclease V alpha subunit
VPPTGSTKDSDFVLVETPDEDAIVSIITRIVEKLYSRRANFQVLSPRHKGTVGVTALNQRLRAVLNPQSPGLQEMRLGSEVVREDDRVMVVKNNYQLGIFNGDVGKIVELDRRAREVVLKLHGPPETQLRMPFRDAPRHLRLAYCMTVHKSQGQEYDIILMPLVTGFGGQLQRNLFYTAITRARQRVLLVGHREALVKSVLNDRMDVRNTLFVDRLSTIAQGGSLAAVGA